ncbi:MAG: serine/threonine-protein kinase, partial [Kofleriaceae bacterium]
MSEEKPSSTEAKTIIGNEGSGAHRRPLAPSEYSMHKPNSRFEQSGLLRPNASGTGAGERTRRPSDAVPATTILPAGALPSTPSTIPGGTPAPVPNNATMVGQPRPRRGSQAGSVTGKSNQWDRHADSNPNFEGDSTGVHAISAMPHPGVRINQYEMIKMIGEGGMGTVYLARDLRLGRRVAIKFLQSNQPELTQRFLVEARSTARCQHDNIVVIYEVGEHNNSPYMVLEFLNGKPLTETIKDGQKLPYTRVIEIMMQVGKALECAHGQGIVHRDLKPDNIFMMDSGTVKVLDFGIAKVLEAQNTTGGVVSSGAIRMPSPLELATGSNNALT